MRPRRDDEGPTRGRSPAVVASQVGGAWAGHAQIGPHCAFGEGERGGVRAGKGCLRVVSKWLTEVKTSQPPSCIEVRDEMHDFHVARGHANVTNPQSRKTRIRGAAREQAPGAGPPIVTLSTGLLDIFFLRRVRGKWEPGGGGHRSANFE